MTFDEAITELEKGNKIAGRFLDGDYVTMNDGIMTLHAQDGDIVDWTPSNSDRLSDEWTVS